MGKIKSIFFNLAQGNRISSEELHDFNTAMELAHNAAGDFRFIRRQMEEQLEAAKIREQKAFARANKFRLMLIMLGLKPDFTEMINELPYRFLQNINKGLRRHGARITHENHFIAIMQKWRWLQSMIQRDLRNVETVALMKKLHGSKHAEVRRMALAIMHQIADESAHIREDIRMKKSKNEILTKSEKFWYEQLQAHNPIGTETGNGND